MRSKTLLWKPLVCINLATMAAPVLAEQRRKRLKDNLCYSGFPARNLTRQINNGGGEWITTYQAEQKRHLRAVTVSNKHKTSTRVIFPPANTRETSGLSNILSKEFLMKTCYVAVPEHLSVASISGYNLVDCNSKSFHEFSRLVNIDASDNQLPFESFECFPSLESLDLSVNSVADVTCKDAGTFSRLQTLNLSYNSVNADVLVFLGSLPALRTLYLTGNNLVSLPPEMATPFTKEGTEKVLMRYPELRSLWLDDNKLCDPSVFAVLAGLRELEQLILSDNELRGVPQLKLLSTGPPKVASYQPSQCGTSLINHVSTPFVAVPSSTPPREQRRPPMQGVKPVKQVKFPSGTHLSTSPGRTHNLGERLNTSPIDWDYNSPRYYSSPRVRTGLTIEDVDGRDSYLKHSTAQRLHKPVPSPPNAQVNSGLTPKKSDGIDGVEEELNLPSASSPVETRSKDRMREEVEASLESNIIGHEFGTADLAPFPKLKLLNLSNNLVCDAEGVLGCECWPSLTKVIISANPLVRSYKGMPPVLQEALVWHRGIQVVRLEPKPERHTTHIREKVKLLKKISSSPPLAVPKYPLLPAIEATPTASPPSRHSQGKKLSLGFFENDHSSNSGYYGYGHQASLGSDSDVTSSVDSLGVFMTQVASNEESAVSGKETEDVAPGNVNNKQEVTVAKEEKVWSPTKAYHDRLRALEERYKDVEERYEGYEVLLDDGGVTGDPSFNIPTDVLGCCKSLQHLLRRPLVLPHYTCHLPAVHKASLPPDRLHTHKKRPIDVKSTRPRQGDVLNEIKRQSVDVETDVASILASRSSSRTAKQLKKECKRLLTEMQRHYDGVKTNSLE